MPILRPAEPARRGPFWALSYARLPSAERASAIRSEFFGRPAEVINNAAFDLVRHAMAAGTWDVLADALPEMRRLMGVSV